MTSSVLVEPAFHTCPSYERTLGPEVADLCEAAGFAPDPEQRMVLDDVFAIGADGKSAVRMAGLVAPRQNIKSGCCKQIALGWLYLTSEPFVAWSAHEFFTTQLAFRDLDELITNCDMLRKRVKQIYRGNGDEAIELLSGARLFFKARTKHGGRGASGPKMILDEGFALTAAHMGALLPIMSAQPDPQAVIASSAGQATSEVLRGIRDRGRAGSDPTMSYLEWCDDLPGDCASPRCDHSRGTSGCRMDDPERWARANSQMGRRIAHATIAAERVQMPPDEFGRERLGWWDEPGSLERAIGPAAWHACLDISSRIVSRPRLAIDVSPAARNSSISASGYDLNGHLVLRSFANGEGTSWVAAAAKDLQDDLNCGPLGYVKGSAAEGLLTDLTAAGVAVEEVAPSDYAAACGDILTRSASADRGLRHSGQPDLDRAVANAGQQITGNRWVWDRRVKGVDITPLCAATTAAHLVMAPEPEAPRVGHFLSF